MSRESDLLLQDIIESGEAIQGYIAGLDFEKFSVDQLRMDAVVRRFEIIGEAVKKLPASATEMEPTIPWRAIAGFRDVCVISIIDGPFREVTEGVVDVGAVLLAINDGCRAN